MRQVSPRSRATAPFGAFSFWHIPGQRGKKSDPQIVQITQMKDDDGRR
jgi:hypothetical protein